MTTKQPTRRKKPDPWRESKKTAATLASVIVLVLSNVVCPVAREIFNAWRTNNQPTNTTQK